MRLIEPAAPGITPLNEAVQKRRRLLADLDMINSTVAGFAEALLQEAKREAAACPFHGGMATALDDRRKLLKDIADQERAIVNAADSQVV